MKILLRKNNMNFKNTIVIASFSLTSASIVFGHGPAVDQVRPGVINGNALEIFKRDSGSGPHYKNSIWTTPLLDIAGSWDNEYPGFTPVKDALPPGVSAIAPGTALGINLIAPLKRWDGSEFNLLPLGETEEFRAYRTTAPTGTTVTSDSGFSAGFNFLTVDATLGQHRHIRYGLLGDGVNPTGGDDGLYLLTLEVTATGLLNSPPVYIIFNKNVDPVTQSAAEAWLAASLVPEPAAATLLVLGSIAMLRRRRLG